MSGEATKTTTTTKIYIIYYSMYGHMRAMAHEVKRGMDKVAGVEATVYQVAETLPADVLQMMYAPPKSDDPIITAQELESADGFVFGIPTRFGSAPAQIKALMDATVRSWKTGGLVGKTAGVFVSSASLGGGQETTVLTFINNFAHHGIIFVPMGPHPGLFDMTEVHGGSAWGAGMVTDQDGSRQASKLEMEMANFQGEQFAKTTKAFKLGRSLSN